VGILRGKFDDDEFDKNLEKLYSTLELLLYHFNIELDVIFEYPIQQTGQVTRTDTLPAVTKSIRRNNHTSKVKCNFILPLLLESLGTAITKIRTPRLKNSQRKNPRWLPNEDSADAFEQVLLY
jgi:hypothetical protein